MKRINENDYVSAYTDNNKIVEGKFNGGFVTNADGKKYRLTELKYVRITEDDDSATDVQTKVADDINKLDADKLKNTSDADLEKAGENREKELKDAGMKLDDGEYKNAFVTAAKATGVMDDVNKGNIDNSQALEKLMASKKETRTDRITETDDDDDMLLTDYYYSQLDNDYHDVPPYDDSMNDTEQEDENDSDTEADMDDYMASDKDFVDKLSDKDFENKQFEDVYKNSSVVQ